MKTSRKLFFFILFSIFLDISSTIISCYYTYENPGIENVDAKLCTHYLLIGTTKIGPNGVLQLPNDTVSETFSRLKVKNPNAKLMLSVIASNPHWSTLVSSPMFMLQFANDSVAHFRKFNLDGIDLDWEFPVWSWDAKKSDRFLLNNLLKTLRQAYGTQYLLSMATSGPPTITRKAYDLPKLSKYCDFVNVMNYDFHVYSWTNPVVGFNAPLRPMSREYSIIGEMNSGSSMETYSSLGLWLNKTVFGIPVYNLGFRLVNYYWSWPYAPAEGEVFDFSCYTDVCNLTSTKHGEVTYKEYWNDKAASSYIVGTDKVWLTTENPLSVGIKAKYAKDIGCAGIMLFQIVTDDWAGLCGKGKFPLINAAKSAFMGEE
ncbi:unnamed protein product, partial [Mesorhabditis belari]|uniref:GH18 domain-containing protein n=1 Tax=Mesorhabditis belari TaxID=2138241 RepID=A0AAF3FKY9_9BILA